MFIRRKLLKNNMKIIMQCHLFIRCIIANMKYLNIIFPNITHPNISP